MYTVQLRNQQRRDGPRRLHEHDDDDDYDESAEASSPPAVCGIRDGTAVRNHTHRIDKYLDTLLANQPISDGEATDHCQKVTVHRKMADCPS